MLKKMNSDLPENHSKIYEEKTQDVHFLNVDLEIWAKEDLQPIIDAFGENILDMGNFKFDNGNRLVSFEINIKSIALDASADEIIRG